MTGKLTAERVADFVFAGNATLTVMNRESGNRFTYKITRKKRLEEGSEDVLFVKVLSRPNNDSDGDYTFIGTIFGRRNYRHSPKSPFGADCQSSRVIEWLVRNIKNLPEKVEVWHEGRCGRCGRKLTVPESIGAGLGPECATRA